MYLKIPIKNKQEGKDIVENHYGGSFLWEYINEHRLVTYPEDGLHPIVMELEEDEVK